MRRLKGIGAIAITGLLFASAIWVFENYCVTNENIAKAAHVGFQFFTSSWPADWSAVFLRTSAMFAVGVVFRAVLVVGPLIVVVRILWGVFAIERSQQMNRIRLLDAFRTLESAIELRVRKDFGLDGQKAKLHASFKKGEEEWIKLIPTIIPGATSEEIQKHLSERSLP